MAKKHVNPAPISSPTADQNHFLRGISPVWLSLAIFLGAFLLYSNGLKNGFVLDDSMIIIKNPLVKKGFSAIGEIFQTDMGLHGGVSMKSNEIVAGGRYRPMSTLCFAILYSAVQEKPFLYHLFEITLFGLTCALVFSTLRQWQKQQPWATAVAFFAAALFAVHPIHTEVVNNIKSLDEILALLFGLLAWKSALKAQDTGSTIHWAASGLFILIACLAKENAICFVGLIPLSFYFRPVAAATPFSAALRVFWPLLAGVAVFLGIRAMVLGWTIGEAPFNLINNAFIKYVGSTWVPLSFGEKSATIMYSLGKYLQLLVFPHPLTTDYYPRQIGIMTYASPWVWLSLLAHIGLLWVAAKRFFNGQRDMICYGILFYMGALFLVSNIPVSLGTNMAERFAFMPSLGFCLAVAYLLYQAMTRMPHQSKVWVLAFGALCLAFAFKTFMRNPDFVNNKTLFFKDIQVSGNSAKMQNAVGSMVVSEAMALQDKTAKDATLVKAIEHFNKALSIHPTYAEAFYGRASAYLLQKKYPEAIHDFRESLKIAPERPETKNNLGVALFEAGKSLVDSNGDMNIAAEYLRQADQLFPDVAATVYYLGMAYFKMGDTAEANVRFDQAKRLKPDGFK